MKRIILILSVSLLAFGNLQHDYLNIGISPRVQALGGVGEICAAGPDSVYYCPALLVNSMKTFQAGMSFPGIDQQLTYAYYTMGNASLGYLTIGTVINQVANIEERVAISNEPDQYSSILDTLFVLGIAKKLSNTTSMGLNLMVFGDNYQAHPKGEATFTAGISHTFTDCLQVTIIGKATESNKRSVSTGVRLKVLDGVNIYSTQDGSDGALTCKGGVSIAVADILDLLVGYNGVGVSYGLSMDTDGLGIELAYTDTPLGGQCSIGISLGVQK